MVKSAQQSLIVKGNMANILFVDDDLFTLETYEKIISLFGHRAFLADSASRAFTLVTEQEIDLIVVDMRLPDMNGFDVLKKLKADPHTQAIPTVMVSASPDVFARRATEAGALKYLCKPIQTDELLEIIEQSTAHKI